MNVEIIDQQARRVATVTHIGPYDQIGQAFERLGALAGGAGLFPTTVPPEMLAVYHDDPQSTPVDQLRSEAGLIVGSDTTIPDGLGELLLPAGAYARSTHLGSYKGLGDAWAELLGVWIPANGHEVGPGGTFEIYRNTLMDTNENDLVTDLFVSIGD